MSFELAWIGAEDYKPENENNLVVWSQKVSLSDLCSSLSLLEVNSYWHNPPKNLIKCQICVKSLIAPVATTM